MKPLAILGVVLALGLLGACSLNPQPLPPEGPDGSLEAGNVLDDAGTKDASAPPSGDATTGIDAANDVESIDAGDAESDAGDAETDASDAETDAELDARDD